MPIHASAAFLLLAIPAALTGAQTVPPFAQQAPLISSLIDLWKDHPDLLGRH